jgi:hypothetical protein
VSKAAKALLFWSLIVISAVVLWRIGSPNWRDSAWSASFVVAFVLIASWFRGRFAGRKKRMASIAIYSVCGIMLTSAIAAWKFVLVSMGYGSQRNLLEGGIASVVFAACCSVLVWSIFRLRNLPS